MSATVSIPVPTGHRFVQSAVAKAWRRRLLVLVVAESGVAAAVVLGALALLLLLGTQILAWPWIVGVAFFAVGWTVWSVRRRMAGRYLVAQMLDQRLLLNDTLSTAWFLENQPENGDLERYSGVFPFEQAERLAQTADAAVAFPFERRWSWWAAAGLFVVAGGLFCARYLVRNNLDLRPAFLPAPMVQVVEYLEKALSPKQAAEALASVKRNAPLPINRPNEEAVKPPEAKAPISGQPQANGKGAAGKSGSSPQPGASERGGKPNQSPSESTAGDGKSAKGADQSGQPPSADAKQPTGNAAQSAQSSGKTDNVMDRMREALSSAMNKLKPANPSDGQKPADPNKNQEQAEGKNQPSDSQSNSAQEQPSQDQSSNQQQGQGSAKSQAAGKDSSQASSKNGSDSQSGVGHSDGDKAIKEAEQAKAMGKLAEIIGKRSASLTGDMHIEPGTNQKLQTVDTHRQGKHADLGGEINRDEISVEDQAYVRQYMELVRKKAAKSANVPH